MSFAIRLFLETDVLARKGRDPLFRHHWSSKLRPEIVCEYEVADEINQITSKHLTGHSL